MKVIKSLSHGNGALVVIPSCSCFKQRKNKGYFLGSLAQEAKV